MNRRFFHPTILACRSTVLINPYVQPSLNFNFNAQLQPAPLFLSTRRYSSQKPTDEDQKQSRLMRVGGSLALGASVLLGKTKYVLVALKLTKAAPLVSMLLTSFAYSFFFGWQYSGISYPYILYPFYPFYPHPLSPSPQLVWLASSSPTRVATR